MRDKESNNGLLFEFHLGGVNVGCSRALYLGQVQAVLHDGFLDGLEEFVQHCCSLLSGVNRFLLEQSLFLFLPNRNSALLL